MGLNDRNRRHGRGCEPGRSGSSGYIPGNDQDNGWYQEPGFIPDKNNLAVSRGNAEAEQEERVRLWWWRR